MLVFLKVNNFPHAPGVRRGETGQSGGEKPEEKIFYLESP